MFETDVEAEVLRLARPDTRWLSTGFDGGLSRAGAAYNVSVPEGWDREDLATYAAQRRERAGFEAPGPTLLTGVSMDHARGARLGSVVAYATVGLSNPAALPMEPEGTAGHRTEDSTAGTVNLIVGTRRSLEAGALASLLSTAAEAKAATLLATAGVPGTTTDAVVVGSGEGEPAAFVGSATEVGSAARACVREAVRASFDARYGEREPPQSVDDAEYGVVTDERAEVFEP